MLFRSSLCLLHVSFFSDLYYVATTRFVGLRLFILFSGVISVFIIVGVVSRVLGFMPSLFSVRRIAISFPDHTRVF